MKVIIVDINRIDLHACAAKLAPVKKIGSAAGADPRLEFPLRNRSTPKVEAALVDGEDIIHGRLSGFCVGG